jgi:hypothetical protein
MRVGKKWDSSFRHCHSKERSCLISHDNASLRGCALIYAGCFCVLWFASNRSTAPIHRLFPPFDGFSIRYYTKSLLSWMTISTEEESNESYKWGFCRRWLSFWPRKQCIGVPKHPRGPDWRWGERVGGALRSGCSTIRSSGPRRGASTSMKPHTVVKGPRSSHVVFIIANQKAWYSSYFTFPVLLRSR